jgi:hypothetical protein
VLNERNIKESQGGANMITNNPLTWPEGWPRTHNLEFSRLAKYSFGRARDDVIWELDKLGAENVIISSNLQVRLDGLPYAGQRQPEDPGIAVYFELNGNQQCIPCDKWTTVEQNLRAIAKTIEALRGIERWGAKEMVNAAFRGFKALPSGTEDKPWYVILGVSPNATKGEIVEAYRLKAKIYHPDSGGTVAAFNRIREAYAEGMGNR